MPPIRRRLRAAAFVISGLAAAGAPALAQNEASNTIGPPQLKDFTLPGQRTTPPASTPTAPTPAPTPPVATPRLPPATTAEPARERPTATPRPPEAAPRSGPAPAAAAPAPAGSGPAPQPAAPPPADSTPIEAAPAPSAGPAVPAPLPAPAPGEQSWLLPAAGGALVLVLAAFFLLRRRKVRSQREGARDAAREEIGGALLASARSEPEPVPEPEPEPEPQAAEAAAPRPWLELDIEPERAAATEHEVYVRYALTLTNKGDADAANIRIDPRLFNAGAEGEMMSFFQGPIHEQSGSPHIVIPPGRTLKLNAQVAMANAELREIELGGRRIFVPMVAINVAYDWAGGGAGRTSRSWLVGREAQTPTEKMGPFRLDLGPRIYRSVGRREARLVMV
ncbi:MAG TPA: LPXTG cell wall anchor domain-containing protein [Allosphingosinicella sp.]|jgi:LPXTG-motif cell wall-anchored protein